MALVVVTMTAIGLGFVIDALLTNETYQAVAAHPVTLKAVSSACYYQPIPRRITGFGAPNECLVRFAYKSETIQIVLPVWEPQVLVLDANNPRYYLAQTVYQRHHVEIGGDVAIGSVLMGASVLVLGVHIYHLRLYRADRQLYLRRQVQNATTDH